MPWITLLFATAATAACGLLALWLIGPLAEVVHWLESVDGGAPGPAEKQAPRAGLESLRV